MITGDWQRRLHEWQDLGDFSQVLPEVAALDGVSQPAAYHAEGDALTHTFMAVASISPDADERVFWAVLLHDIGKALTTEFVDGSWRSHGHVVAGAILVPNIMSRLSLGEIADDVAWLVKHHHFALDWGDYVFSGLTLRQRKFCALPLFPLLIEVCRADAKASQGSSNKGKLLDLIISQLAENKEEKND